MADSNGNIDPNVVNDILMPDPDEVATPQVPYVDQTKENSTRFLTSGSKFLEELINFTLRVLRYLYIVIMIF